MRTLTEFQNEVLTPLRKDRDQKMQATYDEEHAIKKHYAEVKNQLFEERAAFERQQAEEHKAFLREQGIKLKSFLCKQKEASGKAYDTWHEGCCKVKIQRRSIQEGYQDQFGLAVSEYNKERIAAGTPPIDYDDAREKNRGRNRGKDAGK